MAGKDSAKMQTRQGKAVYTHPMHVAETPFAIIKSILGCGGFCCVAWKSAHPMVVGVYRLQPEKAAGPRGGAALSWRKCWRKRQVRRGRRAWANEVGNTVRVAANPAIWGDLNP